MAQLVFLLVTFGLMWLVLIRPQQQRVRRQHELVQSLEVGDEVVTAGGIYGRVVGLDGDVVRIEVAPGIEMRFMRLAVNARVEADGVPAVGPGTGDADATDPVDGGTR